MIVKAVNTSKILAGGQSLYEILDEYLPGLQEDSVVAVTSKIVSICEGNTVPTNQANKDELIVNQASYYLSPQNHKYGYHFSVVDHTLISSSGIDESNGNGHYVLWPKDSQASANRIRSYIKDKHRLKNVGVVITDSTSKVMRRGTVGICIAHSGFRALNDYRDTPDLFGQSFEFSVANVAEGLAGAAVLCMGEGTEQTPLAAITELPFVVFQDRNPNKQELAELKLTLETDYFEVFLNSVPWQKGGRQK